MNLLHVKYPVLFFSNGIGDHFMNLPAIRALAGLFPKKLTLICEESISRPFFENLDLCEILFINSIVQDETRTFDVAKITNSLPNCDLFISLVPWNSISLRKLINYYNPTCTIGFFPNYDVFVPRDHSIHSSDMAFKIVTALNPGLKILDFAQPLRMPPGAIKQAEMIKGYFPINKKIMAIHMDTLPEKMWNIMRWKFFVDEFLALRQDFIVISLGYADVDRIDYGIHSDRIIPCNGLDLPVSIHLLSLCNVFVGIDSSMLHAADFYKVPAIGLYGATNFREFGFRFSDNFCYVTSESGMDGISFEEVLSKALDLSKLVRIF